mgnify:CR=1 FL=1
MNTYRAGIDIGSTTVKLVLLDEEGKLLFGEYRRHCAHTQEALAAQLLRAGFLNPVFYGDRTFQAPGAREERMHVAAVRPE